ncbi:MAG: hypothetical protein ACI4II_02680 [Acutalibacteraceae bacterium]
MFGDALLKYKEEIDNGKQKGIKTTAHSTYRCQYHIVFATLRRSGVKHLPKRTCEDEGQAKKERYTSFVKTKSSVGIAENAAIPTVANDKKGLIRQRTVTFIVA